MLLALIPFIAEGVANDWPKAVACLERTLGSVLANPEKDLRAIVVCQDQPPLSLKDDRYVFLPTRHPKPDRNNPQAKHADKGAKVVQAFTAARDFSPDHVMIVDADDLISNNLVNYVNQRPEFDAFCMKRGYEWRVGSPYFIMRKSFNQVCGTAFVWRYNERVFPGYLGRSKTKLIGELGHNLVEAAMDSEGLNVDKMQEPKAVYVTGHENHMYEGYHDMTWKKRLKEWVRSPWQSRPLTPQLRAEFGIAPTVSAHA